MQTGSFQKHFCTPFVRIGDLSQARVAQRHRVGVSRHLLPADEADAVFGGDDVGEQQLNFTPWSTVNTAQYVVGGDYQSPAGFAGSDFDVDGTGVHRDQKWRSARRRPRRGGRPEKTEAART